MRRLDEILQYNSRFVAEKGYTPFLTNTDPDKKVVVLSCMDSRLVELLQKAMNFKNGDVKIVKNAGATISHPFGSIVRSILVAIYEFGVEEVIVVGHHGCGMAHLNSERVIKKMLERGISPQTFHTLEHAGIEVGSWLQGFSSVHGAIEESVSILRNHPLMAAGVAIHGLIMDPYSGQLDVVVDGGSPHS